MNKLWAKVVIVDFTIEILIRNVIETICLLTRSFDWIKVIYCKLSSVNHIFLLNEKLTQVSKGNFDESILKNARYPIFHDSTDPVSEKWTLWKWNNPIFRPNSMKLNLPNFRFATSVKCKNDAISMYVPLRSAYFF